MTVDVDPVRNVFAHRLLLSRQKRGLTQKQLESAARLPSGTLSQYETGTRSPGLGHLRNLCKALGVSAGQAQLLLIRGLPGSGKSSMARSVFRRGYFDHHLEDDMFHMSRGRYIYEPVNSADAHAWCLNTARVYLNNNRRVVVANTFVMLDQLRPYMMLGFPFHIVEARGTWGSTHNVPEEIVDTMRRRWQELP